MRSKILVRITICVIICVLCYPAEGILAGDTTSQRKSLTIATGDSRPLSIERLVHTAFMDIGYNSAHISDTSLQSGYELANNNERDGVISAVPDMMELYPHLIKVPVALDYDNVWAIVRSDSGLKINRWEDLSGLKVGMLPGRVYLTTQIPESVESLTLKETSKLLLDGLLQNTYDVVIYEIRAHETFIIPDGAVISGQVDTLFEYLYLHEKYEYLTRDLTKALQNIFISGRGDKILLDKSMEDLYPKKTILHLVSNNLSVPQEEAFSREMTEIFRDDLSLEWYTVEFNSRKFSGDPNRLVYLANLIKRDCVSKNISAIIVSGDNALNFVKDYYFLFFRNVPVLFYSVGDNYETVIGGYENYFTGVTENISAVETVSEALRLFPDTTNIYVVNDYATEGQNYRAMIEKQLKSLEGGNVKIEYNGDMSRNALMEKIKELPETSIVVMGSYFCDANGQYFQPQEMKWIMENECPVPIFSVYSTNIVYNSMGGKVPDYKKFAGMIADMLKRTLNGEKAEQIAIISDTESYNHWIFDKALMKKWNIKESSLPSGATIINKNPSAWETDPWFMFSMVALLLISGGIIAVGQVYRRRDGVLREKLSSAVLAAEEASNAKSIFLANMSNEIKTPMNVIIGFSALALDKSTAPDAKDGYLRKIKNNSEKLLQVINDIIDISKMDAGKLELDSIPFDIHDIISICQTIITPKAIDKGITLYYHSEPALNRKLLGDPIRLRQVLLNLLSNAVRCTDKGMVKLLAAVKSHGNDNMTILFEIKDSGVGMTDEEIKGLFESFVHTDASTARGYGDSSGLALTIARDIIELMGGTLKIDSVPGEGSNFSFELTFKTIAKKEEIPEDTRSEEILDLEPEQPAFKGNVMVCDDNAINQQVMRRYLEKVGLNVVIAGNGKEGVETVKCRMEDNETPFNLIFMDMHMPIMDGLGAAKELNRIGNKTPIVALTASTMSSNKNPYKENGIVDYLARPFTEQDLWSCLKKYITPLEADSMSMDEQKKFETRKYRQLVIGFVDRFFTAKEDIVGALHTENMESASEIAQSLKGLAGALGKPGLQEAARKIEISIENDETEFRDEYIKRLGIELDAALNELVPLAGRYKARALESAHLDKEIAAEVFDKLTPMLQSDSIESVELIDELGKIPGTEALIKQIEEYEYEPALETLAAIRRTLEV